MGKVYIGDSYDFLSKRLNDVQKGSGEAPILFPKKARVSTAKTQTSTSSKNSKSNGSKSR